MCLACVLINTNISTCSLFRYLTHFSFLIYLSRTHCNWLDIAILLATCKWYLNIFLNTERHLCFLSEWMSESPGASPRCARTRWTLTANCAATRNQLVFPALVPPIEHFQFILRMRHVARLGPLSVRPAV